MVQPQNFLGLLIIHRIANGHERKCSRIVNFFQFTRKHSRMVIALCEYMVQLLKSSLVTPIFPTKFATVKALRSSIHQCSSYTGHTHLQLLYRVILSNTEVECRARVSLLCQGRVPYPNTKERKRSGHETKLAKV